MSLDWEEELAFEGWEEENEQRLAEKCITNGLKETFGDWLCSQVLALRLPWTHPTIINKFFEENPESEVIFRHFERDEWINRAL